MQSGQLLSGALSQNFHRAIRIIAHPPRNLQHVRFALDKPAKADTLDASADKEAASVDRIMFQGFKVYKGNLVITGRILIQSRACRGPLDSAQGRLFDSAEPSLREGPAPLRMTATSSI